MEKSLVHTKDGLVLSTIEVIHEIGIDHLSIRKVAHRQGVTEGAIFRHYKSKNELLLSVLEYFSKYDSDVFVSVRLKGLSPAESIHYCLNTYATYYENYPSITAIILNYEAFRYEPELREKVERIVRERMDFLKQLIEEAVFAGEVAPRASSWQLALMIWGYFRELCLKWRMEEFAFPLRERVQEGASMILEAFRVKN